MTLPESATPAAGRAVVGLLPSQLAALRSVAPVIARPAGYGSGKSVGLVAWAIHRAAALGVPGGQPVAGLLVEPVSRQIKRVLIPRLREFCHDHGIAYTYKQVDAEWWLHLGDRDAVIYLGSADRPGTLEGPTLAFAGIDEAGLVRDGRAFQAVNARLRWPARGMTPEQIGWANQIHLCGTPEGTGTTFHDWCEGESAARLGTELIRGGTLENHWLPPDPETWIRQKLGNMTSDELDAYARGFFVASGGRVLRHYDPERNEQPWHHAAHRDAEFFMFCDFGFRTVAWLLAARYRERGEEVIHVFDQCVGRNTTTEDHRAAAAAIWEGRGIDLGRVTVLPDETSPADIALLRQWGWNALSARKINPKWQERAHTLNHHLAAGRLRVDAQAAPYAAACLRDLGWGKDGRPHKATDDGTGKAPLDHGFDAWGYGVHRLAPVKPYRPGEADH